MRGCGRAGLLMDSHKRCGSIERVLHPVINDFYLAPEVGRIQLDFSVIWDGQINGVYSPLKYLFTW